MTAYSPTVFVIIVTYNAMNWIDKCLNSLAESSHALCTIIIDNASLDGTPVYIQDNFPNLSLIKLTKNVGFGAANNIGFKKALEVEADYVLLLNQDAYLMPRTVEELLCASRQYREFGILSPFHFEYCGHRLERYFEQWILKHYTPDAASDFKRNNLRDVYQTTFIHAACWLLPMKTIMTVGGFDPLFFHYGEDNDYVQRLHAKKLKAGLVSSSRVYHAGTNGGMVDPRNNLVLLLNQATILFKSPMASDAGAIFLFAKQFFIKQLLGSRLEAKVYRRNLSRIFRLVHSRKIQNKPLAYL